VDLCKLCEVVFKLVGRDSLKVHYSAHERLILIFEFANTETPHFTFEEFVIIRVPGSLELVLDCEFIRLHRYFFLKSLSVLIELVHAQNWSLNNEIDLSSQMS